jgi:hypothetical protein
MTDPTLTRTQFDSASLASLASIAHPAPGPGRWRLDNYGPRDRVTGSIDILVREGGRPRIAVDLAQPPPGCCDRGDATLAPGGMLNLTMESAGDGGYALLYASSGGKPVWDSRRLAPGDRYACMPLRPGLYSVANRLAQARSSVRVGWPGGRPVSGPAPLSVGAAIAPAELRIAPGQVLVFAIAIEARIIVELETPENGPPDPAR